jgi:hypothetical protein
MIDLPPPLVNLRLDRPHILVRLSKSMTTANKWPFFAVSLRLPVFMAQDFDTLDLGAGHVNKFSLSLIW